MQYGPKKGSVVGLYQLVFTSAATRALDVDELLEMLKKSRSDNKKQEITGALLYLSGMFLQVFERPKDEILELYEVIQKDDRNKDIDPINVGSIEGRKFKGWSMGFATPSLEHVHGVEGFSMVRSSDDLAQVCAESGAVPSMGSTLDLFERLYDRSVAWSDGISNETICLFIDQQYIND